MRPACIDETAAYTVVLANDGNVAANWHVDIPVVVVERAPSGPAGQPLSSPRSASPYWAQAQPADGSVAPGQTASFVMVPVWAMPCGGTTYHAAVKLSFPSGASEPDIPLTYAGTGPARYSQVGLTVGSTSMPQPCPAASATPAQFTFAIKNIGNYTAYPYVDVYQDYVGAATWASISSIVEDPPNAVSTWIYSGQTWTVTVQPHAGVQCGGAVYHVYIRINNAQGTSDLITINVTFG
jgi:hypothetical protein